MPRIDRADFVVRRPGQTYQTIRVQRVGPHLSPKDVDNFAFQMPEVGYQAWRNASWLGELAAAHGMTPHDLAERVFPPSDRHKRRVIRRAADHPNSDRRNFWFATVAPEHQPHSGPREASAVLEVNRDVSGGPFGRLMRRLFFPERVYACLQNGNTLPELQSHDLMTALGYVASFDHPNGRPVTLYTPGSNEPAKAFAENYGFEHTGSVVDPNLFGPDVPVIMARYQAPTVQDMRDRMVASHPWLASGEFRTPRS